MPIEDPAARGRLQGHAALVAVQIFFGLFPVLGKLAFEAFAPGAVAAWRIGFGALATGSLALAIHGRRLWPGRRDLGLLALGSLLGISANQLLYLEGLSRSTATNAGLVMCLIPVFTSAIALLARQERFELRRGLGVALALGGALAWRLAERPELVRAHALGNFLMVLNALCYSAYLVFLRPLTRRHPPLVVLAWVYLCALPLAPFFAAPAELVPADAPRRAWLALAYALVFPTFLAYLLNLFALARLSASTTAVYIYVQPLIAALAGYALLGERPTPALGLAALLVFAGIALVAKRSGGSRAPAAELPAPRAGG